MIHSFDWKYLIGFNFFPNHNFAFVCQQENRLTEEHDLSAVQIKVPKVQTPFLVENLFL
jgi:hypothetical protein